MSSQRPYKSDIVFFPRWLDFFICFKETPFRWPYCLTRFFLFRVSRLFKIATRFFLRSVSSHFRLNIKQLSRYEKKKKQITRQHLLTSLHIWNHVSEIWVFFFKIRSVVGTLIKTALPVRVGVHVVDHVCASNVFNSLTLLTIRL